jgi:carboxylesterase
MAARAGQLALAAAIFGAAGWVAATAGYTMLVIVALVILAAVAIGLWNTTPVLFKPDPRYAATPPERVRWPEARPVEPSGRHSRLVFCVHGFPSTPSDFRKIVAASEARGWDVAAPLLPGCGTEPRDFLSTEWSQYLAAVRDEWARLRPRYESACLVGTSMGGSLALTLAAETCANPALAPAGVATIGSPAVLNAWLRYGLVMHPLIYLSRMLGAVVPSIGAALPDPGREGEDGDGDWKGYLGIYTRQTYSLQVGLRDMERKLPAVTCPALVCHARGDRMVDFRNAGILMERLGSSDIEAYVANMDGFGHMRHNLVLYDSQRDKVWKRILDFFEAHAR